MRFGEKRRMMMLLDGGARQNGEYADQVQPVADHHHDQHAQKRPTIELGPRRGRAAYDDGGDGVELELVAGEGSADTTRASENVTATAESAPETT